MIKSFFSSALASRLAVAASLALAFVALGTPAKAQTYHQVDTVVLQGSLIGGQAAEAGAKAASTGSDIGSKAAADAAAVNLGNSASLSTDINATSYQPYGSIGSQVDAVVGQLTGIGGQSAKAGADASAQAATTASSTAANIGNSVTQRAGITSLTSQH